MVFGTAISINKNRVAFQTQTVSHFSVNGGASTRLKDGIGTRAKDR